MKIKFTFLALILLSIQAYSQSKNTISIVYGNSTNGVNIHGVIGDFGYTGKGGTTFGLNYERSFLKSLSIQTGFVFSDDKVQLNVIMPGNTVVIPQDEFKMVTVPVLVKYTFLKYIFIDGGLLADFETNTPANSATTNSQSGIGYEAGIGAKCNLGHLMVFINPYAQDHAVIPFKSRQSTYNLMDAGFKFGLGYSF